MAGSSTDPIKEVGSPGSVSLCGADDDEMGACKGRPAPTPKAPTSKQKAKSGTNAQRPAPKRSANRLCVICQDPTVTVNTQNLCTQNGCRKNVDACWKDAQEQGSTEKFTAARRDPVLFRKLIHDFVSTCGDGGRGKRRPKFAWAQFSESIRESKTSREHGSRSVMVDYFDVLKRCQEKHLDESEALKKWQDRRSGSWGINFRI